MKWIKLWGLTAVVGCGASTGAVAQSRDVPAGGVIPDRYIVVLKAEANQGRVAARHGLAPDHVYGHALNGFAGLVPPGRLRALANDPDVVWVEPDQVATIVGRPSISARRPPKPPEQPPQSIPTGVQRIGVNARTDVSAVGIAIIDTGIDLAHPDLNVQGNVSFVKGIKTGNDDNGHGTHCAGIAAAINNDIGVRGVAPNARLYAVKVLSSSGSGAWSGVIGGIDWVTANAESLGIQVANMSLGGPLNLSVNLAVANSVASGVVYCVAAGNDNLDASTRSPASCPQALAVSAIVDTDGRCGGQAPRQSFYGSDDTRASFSNFGVVVRIAAPGVNIVSTYLGSSYATASGTSMASPHVAGAAALYLASQAEAGRFPLPESVVQTLIAGGTAQDDYCGFKGDTDGFPEPLVNAGGL